MRNGRKGSSIVYGRLAIYNNDWGRARRLREVRADDGIGVWLFKRLLSEFYIWDLLNLFDGI